MTEKEQKADDMFHFLSKHIRKTIKNIEHICDNCLSDRKHQTKDGKMLCDKCMKEYMNEKNLG